MDDILGVQVLEPREDAGDEEAGFVLVEPLLFTDVVPQVTSGHVLHYQVQSLPILECEEDIHQEHVLELGEEAFLAEDRRDALLGEDAELGFHYTAFDISLRA